MRPCPGAPSRGAALSVFSNLLPLPSSDLRQDGSTVRKQIFMDQYFT